MLAMVVHDDAGSLTPLGALETIASMLAPTGAEVVRHWVVFFNTTISGLFTLSPWFN
jgi:hypothetical protein